MHRVRQGEGRTEVPVAPERPENAAFTGPTPLCPLGLTQFPRFQVPVFESSTCELERPGGSQGESARRFGQNPGKRPQRRLEQGQALRRSSALPPTAPHTFEAGSHRLPSPGLLPPAGPTPPRLPARCWVSDVRREDRRGARPSREERTEQSDPSRTTWPALLVLHCPSPGAPSPHSDRRPSPLSPLYSHFPFQPKGGGKKNQHLLRSS